MKRILAFLVITILVCSLAVAATGCKGSSSGDDTASLPSDLIPGGVANVSEEVLAALSESGTVSIYEFPGGNPERIKERDEYFKNVYNGTLDKKSVVWEGWEKVYITDFAADEAPDVTTVFYKLWPKVGNRGMVYSIEELKEKGVIGLDHPTFDDDIELCKQNYSYKGETYAIGVSFKSAVYCCVNTALYKQYNVKSPIEYYNEGTWNYETFAKCCKELTRDSDGDTVIDVFGYEGWDYSWFVVANGGQLVRMDETGKIYECLDTLNVNNALNNIHRLANVDKCVAAKGSFSRGKVGMFAALKTNISKPIGREEITFEWDIVPFPYGIDNKGNTMPGDINGNAISTSTDNPQGALNFIIADRTFEKMMDGKYDEEFLSLFSEEQHTMMADYDNFTDNAFFMGVGSLWNAQWDFWTALSSSKRDVSEVLETYRPMFQAQCELEMQSAN